MVSGGGREDAAAPSDEVVVFQVPPPGASELNVFIYLCVYRLCRIPQSQLININGNSFVLLLQF